MRHKFPTVKKVSTRALQKTADEWLENFKSETQERDKRTRLFYDVQDEDTQDAIDRVADVLSLISHRRVVVKKSGSQQQLILDLPDAVMRANARYLAVEVFKDLGQMDIRVANFKFPLLCVECGKKV